MKTIRLLGFMTVVAGMATLVSASNINCAGPGASQVTVPDVTGLSGTNTCSVIGNPSLVFSNFTVSPNVGISTATVGIAPPSAGTGVVGNQTNLIFQLGGLTWTGSVGFGDILMTYVVTGGLSGIDIDLQASPVTNGGSMTITEIACDTAFVGSNCTGNTLANLSVTSNGNNAFNSLSFSPTATVYIKKDIQFNGATTSEFENSHLSGVSGVPEPMTLSMMGVGLLGLCLFGRKLRK
jgi:hypothetical protein